MTQHSKSRQKAEMAFARTQSQFLARNAVDDIDTIVQAREEKTLRLRKAREAKELEDRGSLLPPCSRKAP